MSQRTRARTTGAAARPINRASHVDTESVESAETQQRERQAKPADASKRGKRAAADAPAADQAPSAPTASTAHAGLPLQPDAVARALRAVATELERDPALAERVAHAINEAPAASESPHAHATDYGASEPEPAPVAPTIGRTFHPRIVTGIADTLGPGVPDPFALRERLGEPGLREALETLRLGSLRAIVRQHKLDPSGSVSKLNDAEKLRAHILKATRKSGK